MAMTTVGLRVLGEYVARAQATGVAEKLTINNAVALTPKQQTALQQLFIDLWKRPDYVCPPLLPLKPRHGYEKRVMKDNFSGNQYIEWLVTGCSDAAIVSSQDGGYRIHLAFGPMGDYPNVTYRLEVPIHSDSHGRVHVDDVIPYGLHKGAKKVIPSGVLRGKSER